MSLANWSGVTSPKPNQSQSPKSNLKRKNSDETDQNVKSKKFCKVMSHDCSDWYTEDPKGLWHCKICRAAKKGNAYAFGHLVPAKTTNQQRHTRTHDHIDAQDFLKLQDQALMKKVLEDELENEEAIISAMKISYCLAVTGQSNSMFPKLIELLDCVGLDVSSKLCKAKNASHVSEASVNEHQSCIAESIMSNIVNEVNKSDESTDMANKTNNVKTIKKHGQSILAFNFSSAYAIWKKRREQKNLHV
ncbi:KAT6A [Mytilus edulis]|uniref:MYST3 n=1 Tax=Mytilus edulis TaxID=6550 RepID=A0A8S3VGP8_MYTED|nr:KAT6A [Mytilus edulis]